MAAVETKVKAGTAAAAVSGVVVFLLARYVFKGNVPDVYASWIYILVPAVLTFAAGWIFPHTPRAAAPAAPSPYVATTAPAGSNVTIQPPAQGTP